jgi:monoamine oxidase
LPDRKLRRRRVPEKPEGNALFAGEHTSTHGQGYLNGGVETGDRAARQVLNVLG